MCKKKQSFHLHGTHSSLILSAQGQSYLPLNHPASTLCGRQLEHTSAQFLPIAKTHRTMKWDQVQLDIDNGWLVQRM